MGELGVRRIASLLAQHYTDDPCNSESAASPELLRANRAAHAVLDELREPLTAALNRLDAGGWEPGRTAHAQQLLRGGALAVAVLTELGHGDEA